jgi:hypothetical protein
MPDPAPAPAAQAGPSSAEILIVSAAYNGNFGIVLDFNWRWVKEVVAIRGEDSVFDDALGVIRKSLEAEVSFLHTPMADTDTPADLVITTRKVNGDTLATTLSNMVPIDASKAMNRDSPPAIWKQRFRSMGQVSLPAQ